MRAICFLLIFCSSINILLAFPVDYNITDIESTDAALENLKDTILHPNFILMLNDFESKIFPITNNVQSRINDVYLYSHNRLNEIERNAENINVQFDDCEQNMQMPNVDDFYRDYSEKCLAPINFLGSNIFSIGFDKQQVVYKNKYQELMDSYKGCLSPGDPAPHSCVGIIIATNEEIRRIFPIMEAYGLEIQTQLNQEILRLTECANTEISLSTQRIQTEFDKAKECIINKIILS